MHLLPSREALHPLSSMCVTLTTTQPPPPVVDVTSSCLHLHIVCRKGHAIAGESREAVGGLRYRIMEIDWVIRPSDAGEAIYLSILQSRCITHLVMCRIGKPINLLGLLIMSALIKCLD
ncbi:hypothetical protein DsansV1_C22g0170491 [Dioscorea sansibarensis]